VVTGSGRIKAISISKQKGTPKVNVPAAELQADHGIVGDAHAGPGHRQISLLAVEAIDALCAEGVELSPGDFAENLTVEGLDFSALRVGCRLRVPDGAELTVTQRGKQCHGRCAIFDRIGDCIMPREGVFARVTRSGSIGVGDIIEAIDD
jgi:MOSC domain-containing protein YiiM